MATQAELIARVQSVNYQRRGEFKARAMQMGQEFTVFCPPNIFCPVQEGDAIHALVSVGPDRTLTILRPPFVQIGTDKDSVLRCFIRVLRGSGFGNLKAHKLYETLGRLAGGEPNILSYLGELAKSYLDLRDDALLVPFEAILPNEAMRKLLTWWHKQRTLRRLWLFGLTNREIENCRLPHDDIYQACLTNPFRLPAITIEKCHEILQRQNKKGDPLDVRCGEIVRKVYFYMENRAWTGVPSRIIMAQFPDYSHYRERLEGSFGVKGEHHTVYLKYPHMVESEVSRYLHELSKTDFDGEAKYGDPNFLRTDLSEDQRAAVAGALKYPVSVITGPAGSGKTSVIAELVHNLELREISYAIVSFTGKAVARIREVIKRKNPATMHRLISRAAGTTPFAHLIIDETSMVMLKLFYQFIRAFPFPYAITFVGDANQLQPIEWGAMFEQVIKSGHIPVYTLTQIHRVQGGAEDGIIANSRRIIEYSQPRDLEADEEAGEEFVPFDFVQTSNFTTMGGSLETVYDIIKLLHGVGVPAEEIVVITPYNRDLEEINLMFQQVYHDGQPFVLDSKGKVWREHMRVTMTENNYDINVMNGEEGTVTALKETEYITVTFKDGSAHNFRLEYTDQQAREEDPENIVYDKGLHVGMLIPSYGLTIHRSQGSEWNYVIVYIPPAQTESSFVSRNMIYTAITRARRAVWCVGDMDSLKAAATRAPAYRHDNLAHRLTLLAEPAAASA